MRGTKHKTAEVVELNPATTHTHPTKIPYDEKTLDELEKLGQLWATREELAGWLKCSTSTLYEFFKRYPDALARYEQGWQIGKTSLRRDQRQLAKTNPSMAIFLGKNYLGQKDIVETAPDRGDGKSARDALTRRIASIATAIEKAGNSK